MIKRGCFSSIYPAIAKSNIDGHMIDKNKPPENEKKLNFSICAN
jgi:hypothetical protein